MDDGAARSDGGPAAEASAAGGSSEGTLDGVPEAAAPAPESHVARLLRPRVVGVPLVTLALLAFAAFVVLTNYIPTRIETLATQNQLADQQAENEQLANRIRVAEVRTRTVETDRWTNERILRDELRMIRKGEAIVR